MKDLPSSGIQGEHRFLIEVDAFTADVIAAILKNEAKYHVEFSAEGDMVGVLVVYQGK